MNMRTRWILLLILTPMLAGCNGLSGAISWMNNGESGIAEAAGLYAITPTPFLPIPETATPEFSPQPSVTATPDTAVVQGNPWGDFLGPVEVSAIEIPPPMAEIEFPSDAVNIVILGSDQRPDGYGYRTDTIMIISFDPDDASVTILAVPRDLYVYIPGWRVERINTADAHGGPEMLADTIQYNFGIPIDHWARINFTGYMRAIDNLGGIDVDVTGYMADECGGTYYTYWPGVYHMDGFTSLCYVRMRKSSSDFDRLRREQEVLKAVFNKVISLDGLSKIPQFYSQFDELVLTDIGLADITSLIPLAASLASGSTNIDSYSIDPSMTMAWRVPYSGAAVLLPNRDAIIEMLEAAYSP